LPRRTLRKATRWTPEECSQIEQAAAVRSVPPLRYVREAALGSAAGAGDAGDAGDVGGSTTSSRGRTKASRRAHDFVNQLARVLNNLRQIQRVAEVDGDEGAVGLLIAAAAFVEDAISLSPATLGERATDALAGLVEVGVALNALAHRVNTVEEVPPADELHAVLAQVQSAVRNAVRRSASRRSARALASWLLT
jgi:hypothetical protein